MLLRITLLPIWKDIEGAGIAPFEKAKDMLATMITAKSEALSPMTVKRGYRRPY